MKRLFEIVLAIVLAVVILITLLFFNSKMYYECQNDSLAYSILIWLYLLIHTIVCEIDLYLSIKSFIKPSKVIYRIFNGITIPVDIAVIIECFKLLVIYKPWYFPMIAYFAIRSIYSMVYVLNSDE